jgi:co-chaperonin GroES (HSP10)
MDTGAMIENPFVDAYGNDTFPYQAIRDVVFVLPVKDPEKIGSIIIPEMYRINHRDEYGIVLTVGRGAYIPKFKKWIPTTVKPGEVVIYDAGIPWEMYVMDRNYEKHLVKVMGERDIQGIVRGLK